MGSASPPPGPSSRGPQRTPHRSCRVRARPRTDARGNGDLLPSASPAVGQGAPSLAVRTAASPGGPRAGAAQPGSWLPPRPPAPYTPPLPVPVRLFSANKSPQARPQRPRGPSPLAFPAAKKRPAPHWRPILPRAPQPPQQPPRAPLWGLLIGPQSPPAPPPDSRFLLLLVTWPQAPPQGPGHEASPRGLVGGGRAGFGGVLKSPQSLGPRVPTEVQWRGGGWRPSSCRCRQ